MSNHVARIEPVSEPYSEEVTDELARWMPPGAPVDPLALFRTLCRDLPLASAMRPLGEFQLSRRSALPLRVRELAIGRTCARLGAEYEWGVHAVAYQSVAGLSDAELAATVVGDETDFDGQDSLVIELVDQLVDTRTVDDGLWAALVAEVGEKAVLELLVLCGWYHLIGFVVNGARVTLEPWAARFPQPEVAK